MRKTFLIIKASENILSICSIDKCIRVKMYERYRTSQKRGTSFFVYFHPLTLCSLIWSMESVARDQSWAMDVSRKWDVSVALDISVIVRPL